MNPEKKYNDENYPHTAQNLLKEPSDRQAAKQLRFWFSKRFLVVVLLFLGNLIVMLLKSNLNIAIVKMQESEYNWDKRTVGVIQSAYAYGDIFAIFGASIIIKLGGAVVFGTSTLMMAITNILTPICLKTNYYLFLGSRTFLGFLDAIGYMGGAEVLSRWAPLQERSRITALSFWGMYVGSAVSYPICGFIVRLWRWQTVFYFSGVVGVIWSTLWLLLVRNQPTNDKLISKKELSYIVENTETISRKRIVHPYLKILTSPQVWALCVGKFTYSWGLTLLLVCLPLYVKDVTGRDTAEVGVISSIPNIVCIFAIPLAGFLLDLWKNNSNLEITQIHKIVMCTGFTSGAVFFFVASQSTSFILSMTCFVLILFIVSSNSLILQLVSLYMSPIHSSILTGISGYWFTVSVFMVPNMMGFVVHDKSLQEWSFCFLLSGGIFLGGALIFLIYGSSELQPWSMSTTSDSEGQFSIENEKSNNN